MAEHLIDAIVAGSVEDPDGGPAISVPTRSIAIEKNLDGCEADLVGGLGFGPHLMVVSDTNTREALGERVERALSSIARVERVVLPGTPHADMHTAALLQSEIGRADALIAVGSGTINDLCKFAAAQAGKPYAVFATAPSMNGYTSVNAAITVDGLKKTLPAQGATGVFMDLRVLADAPRRMILSGFGDSVCRSTAQADWLLSHLLWGSAYREAPYRLLAEDEDALLAEPEALAAGDLDAMECLARTLVLSGFGMTICGGSAPASQGEHMISHFMDMLPPPGWPGALHGEQIAVTTLTAARLQERVLADGRPRPAPNAVARADVDAVFGKALGAMCWQEFEQKTLDAEHADQLNAKLKSDWDGIRDRIAVVSKPAAVLEHALRRAGAPMIPEDIGLSREYYERAVLFARTIRNRYCFLDLAADSGILTAQTVKEL